MNKLLTIIIPIYNTQDYLKTCLDSLIIKEQFLALVEVLLIIDGSPDNSLAIAKEYAVKYPQTFVVINKENGGYGSVLKRGIQEAKGKYCKVLDSDDWYDQHEFENFVNELQTINHDVIVTDYVKEFVFENRSELQTLFDMKNKQVYELDEDINKFEKDVFVMHRLAYKTIILRKAEIEFPEKVFYTDTLFASIPLFFAKDVYYTNLKLYRYFIGRDGQTIAPESIRKNRKSVEIVIKYYYQKFLENKTGMSIQKRIFTANSLKNLVEMYYRILHHLPFPDAQKELSEWHNFIKKTEDYNHFSNCKMIKYFNILPYIVFRYTSFIWKN
ncbi:glycosyltransferase family 2 protein [Empedobacter brevis]|uniref:Glycosyltransferase family 2 protein n=1 Tax=Empedobacter brevis TaxID=247 RepID=A0AAJ1QFB8_9FLAO|nr:glycosyltransferase [Empedobacter brevis]MDM1073043.1 glycosyltransferase family 2 protein [Empedobacter brevis]